MAPGETPIETEIPKVRLLSSPNGGRPDVLNEVAAWERALSTGEGSPVEVLLEAVKNESTSLWGETVEKR